MCKAVTSKEEHYTTPYRRADSKYKRTLAYTVPLSKGESYTVPYISVGSIYKEAPFTQLPLPKVVPHGRAGAIYKETHFYIGHPSKKGAHPSRSPTQIFIKGLPLYLKRLLL